MFFIFLVFLNKKNESFFIYSPCKKSFQNFKNFLLYLDEKCQCNLSEDEMKMFSFSCSFCNNINTVDFQQICTPYTIFYLRNMEINNRIDEEINNLLKITKEKLNLQKNL